jgi:hypothetical protein
MAEAFVKILVVLLETFGPAIVRREVDRWETARATSNAAFEAKFGVKP